MAIRYVAQTGCGFSGFPIALMKCSHLFCPSIPQCWTFHHPDFQRSNRDALENIKRKVPAQRKAGRGGAATGPPLPGSPSDAATGGLANVDTTAASSMQAQIDALSRSNEDLAASLTALDRNYQNVLNEMVVYQRGMAAQDSLMQNLISYFIQLENGTCSARPEKACVIPQH